MIIKNIFVVNEFHKDQFSYLLKKSNKSTINKLKEEDKYQTKRGHRRERDKEATHLLVFHVILKK